jgi:CRP-like cAMP-binding protein
MSSIFSCMSDNELKKFTKLAERIDCGSDEQLFTEGDEADFLYYIETGQVSLYIQKFNTDIEIERALPGDWFGEIAVFNESHRTASAKTVEPTSLLRVAKRDFHGFIADEPKIGKTLKEIIDHRSLRLVLEEKMLCTDFDDEHGMHIGIKGDPSLRESALERNRYASIVDRYLPELSACFDDLLLHRSVHRLTIGFNNGEVRISTLLDPLAEEFHPALRLLDASYVDRHFPKIDYQEKVKTIRRIYQTIRNTPLFTELPQHLHHGFADYFDTWKPVPAANIARTIAQLETLRNIPNFYIRSLTINIMKDAVHMQFNCDGTHIVSTAGFERFIEENI